MRLSPLSQVRSAITGKNLFPVTIRQIQVSITDSITSFPLSFWTAITMASLCTSMPIVCGLPDYVEEVLQTEPRRLGLVAIRGTGPLTTQHSPEASRRLKALEK